MQSVSHGAVVDRQKARIVESVLSYQILSPQQRPESASFDRDQGIPFWEYMSALAITSKV